jgi:queuine tRNA-ribosyltransferase
VNDDPLPAGARHEIIRTRAGALAMRSREAGEIMHPGVGPQLEAEQLYVRQSRLGDRLRTHPRATFVLFDVGLGAGSNAVGARAVSEAAPAGCARLELVSFERDCEALELALDAGETFGFVGAVADAGRALLAHGRHETARTCWRLEPGDLLAALARLPAATADIIYWDPYSPRANPQLWTVAAFAAARRCAGPGCTLFTYSASTATRVALLLAGWHVGVGDATGSKERTTAAAVDLGDLARPLDRSWLTRLERPQAPWPADAPASARADVIAAPQFRQTNAG